jgi:hypothetical protein
MLGFMIILLGQVSMEIDRQNRKRLFDEVDRFIVATRQRENELLEELRRRRDPYDDVSLKTKGQEQSKWRN